MKKRKATEPRQRNRYSLLLAVALVAGFYAIMQVIGITCPIKFITGISCPGCGMSRALFSMVHLNFIDAFEYHPLFWLPLAGVLVYLLRNHINEKTLHILIVISIVLICIIYLYRMIFTSSNIVTFEPRQGIIGQLLQNI